MRRNCNLELQLFPSPTYYNDENNNENNNNVGEEFSGTTDSDQSQQRRTVMEASTSNPVSPKQNQPLTIFYNGKICVCDVNEFQAKAILLLANREADERAKTPRALAGQEPPSPSVPSAAYSPNTALSMKKSLQMFLQKRKHRAQAMTPYHR